jgi:peptidoglycan-associated lipoprotein
MKHMNQPQKRTLIAVAAVAMLTGACAKKKVAAAPPPAPAPAATPASTSQPAPASARAAATRPNVPAATPASPYPSAATRARIDELLARIEDAYFDYDKANLRPDAMKALQADSNELRDILKDFPDYKLTIEGHCDDRGSAEYNVALGDRRASAAKEYLVGIGIPSTQLRTISYGKEKPVCDQENENCWQRNRRIHIVAAARAQE